MQERMGIKRLGRGGPGLTDEIRNRTNFESSYQEDQVEKVKLSGCAFATVLSAAINKYLQHSLPATFSGRPCYTLSITIFKNKTMKYRKEGERNGLITFPFDTDLMVLIFTRYTIQ